MATNTVKLLEKVQDSGLRTSTTNEYQIKKKVSDNTEELRGWDQKPFKNNDHGNKSRQKCPSNKQN